MKLRKPRTLTIAAAVLGLALFGATVQVRAQDIPVDGAGADKQDQKDQVVDPEAGGPPVYRVSTENATLFFVQPKTPAPPGGRPTIVIVPGLGCAPQDYSQVTAYLQGKGYNVAVFETEGNSTNDPQMWVDRVGEATNLLLAHDNQPESPLHGTINAGELGIVGHSLGGSVATFVAAKDPRFKALVTFGPGGKDMSFLDDAKNVKAATLAIDGSLDQMTPPDKMGGVVAQNANTPYKAQIVIKGGAHPNAPADYNADYIRGPLQLIPTVLPFWPFVKWDAGFPVLKDGPKPMPADEQRKIAFSYLGPWLDRFVANTPGAASDFGARAAADLKDGVLTVAKVSAKAKSAPAAPELPDGLAEKIRERGADQPRSGFVDSIVGAGLGDEIKDPAHGEGR